jgi:16S rRNA (cytidine1402-2'-O)-methyltransferase
MPAPFAVPEALVLASGASLAHAVTPPYSMAKSKIRNEPRRAAQRDMGKAAGNTKPTLYVVATPIGNLKDVTLRALDVLKEVDVIAAEDTRVTSRLLNHYGITARKLIALHEHNEQRSVPRVLALLEGGSSVALTSDAGTPAFSDPGARLIKAVREAGHPVVPIPGPNAAATALSASGLAGPQFVFYGFLPAKTGERQKALHALAAYPFMLVFYEAPHRVMETVRDLSEILGGNRKLVIARELTKLFESVHACPLSDAEEWLAGDGDRVKGEFVLLVEGARGDADAGLAEATRILELLLEELPLKQASALTATITGVRKNELYALALEMKRENQDPG